MASEPIQAVGYGVSEVHLLKNVTRHGGCGNHKNYNWSAWAAFSYKFLMSVQNIDSEDIYSMTAVTATVGNF